MPSRRRPQSTLSPTTLVLVLALASLAAASLHPIRNPNPNQPDNAIRRRSRVQEIQVKLRNADDGNLPARLRRQISVDPSPPAASSPPAAETTPTTPAPAPAPVTTNPVTTTNPPAPAPAPVTTATDRGGNVITTTPAPAPAPSSTPIVGPSTGTTATSQSVSIVTIITTDANSNIVTQTSSIPPTGTSLPDAQNNGGGGGGSKTGLIVAGSVIGGLVALGGIGYAIWFFCRKRGYDDGLNDDAIRWPELVRHGSRGHDTLNELNPIAAQRKEGAAGVGGGEDDDDLRSNVGGGGGAALSSVSGTMTMRSGTRSPGPGMMYAGQNMSTVPLTAGGPYYDDPRGQGFYDPYAQTVPSPYVYAPGNGIPNMPAGYYSGPQPGFDAYGNAPYRPGTPNLSSESGQTGGAGFSRKPSVGAETALGQGHGQGGEGIRRSPTPGGF